jgi:ATP-dependent helicase IRC3
MSSTPVRLLRLRPYQEDALTAIERAQARGITRPLLVLPTGSGKTVIFAHLLRRRPGRALVLGHRDELLWQAADKLAVVAPSATIGVVKARLDAVDAHVVLASVQTLSRERRLSRLRADFDVLIVDEAHHACAQTYRRTLEYLGAFADGGPLTLGVTATPERSDKAVLGEIWQEIVYHKSLLEMIIAGYLVDLCALQVMLAVDYQQLHIRRGDFIESELERVLLSVRAPTQVAQAYLEYAAGRKAVVFTPTVYLAHAMVEAFTAVGVAAEALDGTTPLAARRAMVQRLHTGATQVVANCGVLTEGFDEPSIDCIIMARPTRSRPLYVQCIGRGTRPYPGKRECLILDLVGATTRHDLVTVASLFGVSPGALIGRTLTEAVAAEAQLSLPFAVAGTLVARPVELFRRRPLHWVQVGESLFVLSLSEGWVALEARDARWRAVVYSREGQRRVLGEELDLGYAQGLAEDSVRRLGDGALVHPRASWRRRPASEKQRAVLRSYQMPLRPELTAGEASDLIVATLAGKLLPGGGPCGRV